MMFYAILFSLSTYLGRAPVDDSPAERFVLAKLALEKEEENGPLVRLLLHQALAEREPSLIDLVGHVELLTNMTERRLIRLQPSERGHLRALSARTDALILRRSKRVLSALFRQMQALAAIALSRAGGRPVRMR